MVLRNRMFDTTPGIIHANGMAADAPLAIIRKMGLEYEFTDPYNPAGPKKEDWFRVLSTGELLTVDSAKGIFDLGDTPLRSDIAIITWTDGNSRNILEYILNANRIPYHNLVKHGQSYQSMLKITATLEFLKSTDYKYIIGCDAKDVMFLQHPNLVVEKYVGSFPDQKMVINGELNDAPKFLTTFEHESYTHTNSPYRFVNSGVYIADRSFLIVFLEKCLEYFNAWVNSNVFSHMQDQACFKLAYPDLYPTVKLDYDCNLLQTLFFIEDKFITVDEK